MANGGSLWLGAVAFSAGIFSERLHDCDKHIEIESKGGAAYSGKRWPRLLAQQSSRTERSQSRGRRRNDCVKNGDRPRFFLAHLSLAFRFSQAHGNCHGDQPDCDMKLSSET